MEFCTLKHHKRIKHELAKLAVSSQHQGQLFGEVVLEYAYIKG